MSDSHLFTSASISRLLYSLKITPFRKWYTFLNLYPAYRLVAWKSSVETTDSETGEDVDLYLSEQYQTMDSWDDTEDGLRTIYYVSDDVKNALENDYTDWESLLWQLQL